MTILEELNDRIRLLIGAPPLLTRERLLQELHESAERMDEAMNMIASMGNKARIMKGG